MGLCHLKELLELAHSLHSATHREDGVSEINVTRKDLIALFFLHPTSSRCLSTYPATMDDDPDALDVCCCCSWSLSAIRSGT